MATSAKPSASSGLESSFVGVIGRAIILSQNIGLRTEIRKLLATAGIQTVAAASRLSHALNLMRQDGTRADVVFSDLKIEDGTLLEIGASMLAAPELSGALIFAIIDAEQRDDGSQLLGGIAVGVVHKPIQPKEFLPQLAEVCRVFRATQRNTAATSGFARARLALMGGDPWLAASSAEEASQVSGDAALLLARSLLGIPKRQEALAALTQAVRLSPGLRTEAAKIARENKLVQQGGGPAAAGDKEGALEIPTAALDAWSYGAPPGECYGRAKIQSLLTIGLDDAEGRALERVLSSMFPIKLAFHAPSLSEGLDHLRVRPISLVLTRYDLGNSQSPLDLMNASHDLPNIKQSCVVAMLAPEEERWAEILFLAGLHGILPRSQAPDIIKHHLHRVLVQQDLLIKSAEAQPYARAAFFALTREQFEGAAVLAKRGWSAYPLDGVSLLYLAMASQEQGLLEDAEDFYRKAAQNEPRLQAIVPRMRSETAARAERRRRARPAN